MDHDTMAWVNMQRLIEFQWTFRYVKFTVCRSIRLVYIGHSAVYFFFSVSVPNLSCYFKYNQNIFRRTNWNLSIHTIQNTIEQIQNVYTKGAHIQYEHTRIQTTTIQSIISCVRTCWSIIYHSKIWRAKHLTFVDDHTLAPVNASGQYAYR